MSTPIKTRDNISIRTMLEQHASCLSKDGKKYYFLPFYFMDEEPDEFEMLHLEHLPEELKEGIEFLRNDVNNSSENTPLSDNPWHNKDI